MTIIALSFPLVEVPVCVIVFISFDPTLAQWAHLSDTLIDSDT